MVSTFSDLSDPRSTRDSKRGVCFRSHLWYFRRDGCSLFCCFLQQTPEHLIDSPRSELFGKRKYCHEGTGAKDLGYHASCVKRAHVCVQTIRNVCGL